MSLLLLCRTFTKRACSTPWQIDEMNHFYLTRVSITTWRTLLCLLIWSRCWRAGLAPIFFEWYEIVTTFLPADCGCAPLFSLWSFEDANPALDFCLRDRWLDARFEGNSSSDADTEAVVSFTKAFRNSGYLARKPLSHFLPARPPEFLHAWRCPVDARLKRTANLNARHYVFLYMYIYAKKMKLV